MRVVRSSWVVAACGVACAVGVVGSDVAASTERRDARTASAAGAVPLSLDRVPVRFEENRGQTDARVDFIARCRGYMAFVTPGEIVLSLPGATPPRTDPGPDLRPDVRPQTPPEVLRLRIENASTARGRALEPAPGRSNYLIGQDRSRWRTDVPSYQRVAYPEILPNTDLVLRGDERRLRFDFVLAPGADPEAIALRCEGAKTTSIDGGELRLRFEQGEVRISEPVAFQTHQGWRRDVAVHYVLRSDGAVGFEVGDHDPTRPLVIDPTVTWSTYVGGADYDYSLGIAVDSTGSAIVGGYTRSTDFPVGNGAYQSSKKQDANPGVRADAFVAKFAANGQSLAWATYIGGSADDYGIRVAVDGNDFPYVSGYTTASDFPTLSAYESTKTSGLAAFATKLNKTGTALVYSTYLNYGISYGLAVDSAGSAYVLLDGVSNRVVKLSTSGSSAAYVTTHGVTGSNGETAYAIAVDSSGNAFVAGSTQESGFSTTSNAYQRTFGGGRDAFVFKLDPNGSVAYSTFLGGGSAEYAYGIAADGDSEAYVVGMTQSSDFPRTTNAEQSAFAGSWDTFVAKLSSDGTALRYGTYLGGASSDYGQGVAVRGKHIYVAGNTYSDDFPLRGAHQSQRAGQEDAFLSVFRCDGVLQYSSYFGGIYPEYPSYGCVATDSSGDAYLTGYTYSPDYPTAPTGSVYDTTIGGNGDGFVTKVSSIFPTAFAVTTTTLPDWTAARPHSAQLEYQGGAGAVTWSAPGVGLPGGMTLSSSGLLAGTPAVADTYVFTARVTDTCGFYVEESLSFVVNPPPQIGDVPLQDWTRAQFYMLPLSAWGGTPPLDWSITSGSEPAGTTFDATGTLSGAPTTVGTTSFDARITDARGSIATRTVTMRVNERPAITTTSIQTWTEHTAFTQRLTLTGGTLPITWSGPTGTLLTVEPIDAVRGEIDGTTADAGAYDFTVRVTDAAGATADRAYSAVLNPYPQVLTTELPIAAEGRPYRSTLVGTGGTAPRTWSVVPRAPDGMYLDFQSGVLQGTPTTAGSSLVSFEYVDSCLAEARQQMFVVVAERFGLDLKKNRLVVPYDFLGSRDARVHYVELLEGSTLGVTVTAALRAKGPYPFTVRLLDPTGAPVDISEYGGVKGRSFKLSKFPVPTTGRWFLELTPNQPFEGTVTITVGAKAVSRWTGVAAVDAAGAPVEIRLPVLAGTLLAFGAKPVKKSDALPVVESVMQGGVELLVPGELKVKGAATSLKMKTPLAGGEVVIRLHARDGSASDVAWTATAKPPKIYGFTLPDVPAGE